MDYDRRMEMMRFAKKNDKKSTGQCCLHKIQNTEVSHLKLIYVILILLLFAKVIDFIVVVVLGC